MESVQADYSHSTPSGQHVQRAEGKEVILGDRILFCSCPPGSGGAAKGAPSVYGQRNEASIAGSRGARCRQVSPKDKSLKECKTRAKTNILNWVSNPRGQTMSRN